MSDIHSKINFFFRKQVIDLLIRPMACIIGQVIYQIHILRSIETFGRVRAGSTEEF